MSEQADDCKHMRPSLIISERRSSDHRAYVAICLDCGAIIVLLNGAYIDFKLTSDAQVVAAGLYAKHLQEEAR